MTRTRRGININAEQHEDLSVISQLNGQPIVWLAEKGIGELLLKWHNELMEKLTPEDRKLCSCEIDDEGQVTRHSIVCSLWTPF